ncbi:sensor histidine kinase [Neobacillus piezotolerans]|nr:LytS/YhcK type 5TM receptor domain-containing protein [Neobacillus piezotolerans]
MIVTVAFLITRLKLFRQMIYHRLSYKGKMIMIIVFGLFGVIGNYAGIEVHPEIPNLAPGDGDQEETFKAIADIRNIGVIIGGLIGGPVVGFGAGVIAGGHRYLLGGFISTATFILTVLGGLIAGFIGRKLTFNEKMQPPLIFVLSVLILFMQIILVPVLAKSHSVAFQLIQYTGLPIIIVNGIGIWICALIFYSVIRDEEKVVAKMRALQAQIQPHFLFNSINVISALCKRDPMFARSLLLHLSTFLRNNTSATNQTLIPIEKEIETVNAYFSLEQARFPERFHLRVTIEPFVNQALIPPFTIQPIVENAIVHGFSERCEQETVEVTICKEGKRFLRISIKDNGNGINSDRLNLIGSKSIPSSKGTGIAISNIRERLSLAFGPKAQFSIESQLNMGTTVTIIVPLQYERKENLNDKSLRG